MRREYFSWAENGLRNSRKFLHLTQRDLLNLNSLHRDEWILQRCSCSALNNVLSHLPCYLLHNPLKRDFFRHLSNIFSAVRKFKNTCKLWWSSFSEKVQNWIKISKMQKEIQNIFFVSEIVASENVAINCLY